MIKFPSNRPYTEIEALVDYFCNIKRGRDNVRTSCTGLAEKWMWSKSSVHRFITMINLEQFWNENETLLRLKNSDLSIPAGKKVRRKRDDIKQPFELKVYDEKIFEEILEYLNEKTGRKYNFKTLAHIKWIKARLNEGFTIENFKTVIDIKVNDWLGTDMSKFLRPETLFGNKFDGYLNQKIDTKKEEMKRIRQEVKPILDINERLKKYKEKLRGQKL